jgi:glycosyltransferase involved in cell wall biosynthesis
MMSCDRVTVVLSANTSWYLYNFRSSTISAILRAGHRVVCLSPPDDYVRQLIELGVDWRPLPMDNSGRHPVRDFVLLCRIFFEYRRLNPLVVFNFTIKNNIYGALAARVLGISAISNVSGLGTAFIRSDFVSLIAVFLYRLSQRSVYRVFCQNPEDFGLIRSLRLVPSDSLVLLPGSGVDLQRFHPSLRVNVPVVGAPLRLLFAGRMLADKGLYELIEAVVRINSVSVRCELTLCGFADADNISAISQRQLSDWALLPGISWSGPSDDMPAVYSCADAVVLPSYREGLPRSLLEAAAMGLPVVATDVPGCRHVVTHAVSGFLCEARNVDSLVSALERLLALTHAERAALGAAGRSRVEAEFDEQRVVQSALDVVEEIIGSSRIPKKPIGSR